MDINLNHIIEQVGREKGIAREVLVEALEAAMLTAARKKFGGHRDIEVHYSSELGEVEVFEFKQVVETVDDPERQILLEEARVQDPEAQLADAIGIKMDSALMGRIAAQTAKQVLIQRWREAEREMIFNRFKDRKGEIITGIARRFERGNVIVDINGTEAILPLRDQTPRENYRAGDRVVAYVKDIDKEARGPLIILSRTDVGLLLKLFEMEVPEIYEGIVRIVAAAREPGARSKIAVASRDSDVDPIGACVGMKGSRVQAVVQELRGEKIDIVPYNEEPAKFVVSAISPADVARVIIDEDTHTMELIVPDDQLSLAIGRKGQNVRLASQLTGWKIDIHSESQMALLAERGIRLLNQLPEITRTMAEHLYKLGYQTARDIIDGDPSELNLIMGVGADKMREIVEVVREIVAKGGPTLPPELEPQMPTPPALGGALGGPGPLNLGGASVPSPFGAPAGLGEPVAPAAEKPAAPAPTFDFKIEEMEDTSLYDEPIADEKLVALSAEHQRFARVKGIGQRSIDALRRGGYRTVEDVDRETDIDRLAERCDLGLSRARQIKYWVAAYLRS
jgi:N utilization substance protein A